jgi:hypothetical protein
MAASKKQMKQASAPTAEAAFVFVGKVLKVKAATMENLAGDNTAIVLVESVVSAPEMFRSLGGHEITARFKKAGDIQRGKTLTFFANGWIFGASVAVDVVATTSETEAPAAASMVRSAATSNSDAMLRERLDSAETVVAGRVASVAKSEKGPTHISEHDPDWHEATVDVDEVVKGKKGTKQVTVLFPRSDDVRWHRVPKYGTGDQGVWLLQPGKKQQARGIPPKQLAAVPTGDVLTTLHPCDFLPLHELERVKALAGK